MCPASKRRMSLKGPQFLGESVSAGLCYEGGHFGRLKKHGLPQIEDGERLAIALGLPITGEGDSEPEFTEGADQLAWLCYHRELVYVDHYNRFKIPKKAGGYRRIASPKPLMRHAQRWVLNNIVENLEPNLEVSTAWRKGCSTLKNASRHSAKAVVVRIDIKDFFPTINWRRVRGVFMKLGYSEGVATLLALLCTDAERTESDEGDVRCYKAIGKRALPQGACTSPGIANFVALNLDRRVRATAGSMGFLYTRYADDLIFSSDSGGGRVGELIRQVYRLLLEEGFHPNRKKTAVMRRHQRQIVTGILVNDTPRISRRDCRRFRAIAHRCRTQGLGSVTVSLGCSAADYLRGYLSYVEMVNPAQAKALAAQLEGLALDE